MNATKLVEDVLRQYENIKLSFSGPNYWNTLKLTYVRTVGDVLAAAQELRQQRGESAPINILEIGAFAGVIATALRQAGFTVTAADIPLFMKDEMLLQHYQKEGIMPLTCNLAELPLAVKAGSFDIIICCEVLEHLNFNVIPVFKEMNRLLSKGGVLYLATPNLANIATRLRLLKGKSIHNPVEHLMWQLDPNSDFSIGLHWREFTLAELNELAVLARFKTIRQYYCHYNDRSQAHPLRRTLVSLMYKCFPAFLPGQVLIAAKQADIDR